jgi:hypothetical protein
LYTDNEQDPVVKLVVIMMLASASHVAWSTNSLACIEASNAES